MKKIIPCLLIPVFLLTSLCLAQESPKEAELLFMAKKAYEDGFYEVALGMLERFQKEFPGSIKRSQARLLTAQSYFHQGRYSQALKMLEDLSADQAAAEILDAVYFWIAELYFKTDSFDKAVVFYQKLINDFPRSSYVPAAYYSLGWAYSQMGQYSLALASLKSLLESFPSEPQSKDAAFKLLECLYNLKEYSELKNKIKSVFKLYANDPLRLPYLYFYLAESEYYLDELDEAAKDYLKAAQSFKDGKARALANLGLGWSYLKIKKYDQAGEVLAGINQDDLDKKSLDIFILAKAVLMAQSERVYEAKKFYQQLLDLSTDPLILLQAYIGKADVFYNLAEYSQAIKVYREGLDKVAKAASPINGSAELIDKLRYNLGLAYVKEGDIKSGAAVFEEVVDKSPDPAAAAGALCQIGDVYQDAGENLKAEGAYLRLLKEFPDSPLADYALYQSGRLQSKRTDFESAIASFKLLLKNYPRSKFLGLAVYSLGVIYFDKQDYLSSFDIFSRFQNEFKESSLSGQAVLMLGLSLVNLNKINQALDVFKDIPRDYPQELELIQKAEYEAADCYYKLGQEKEALRRFELLRVKYPGSSLTPGIMWWLGKYYYRLNDLNLAARYFSSLAKDFPDNSLAGDAFYALGSIYFQQDNYEQAKVFLKKALSLAGPKDTGNIQFSLAEVYEANNELDMAASIYLQAADSYNDNQQLLASALLRCARIYEDKGDFKAALDVYERIAQTDTEEAKFARERIESIKK